MSLIQNAFEALCHSTHLYGRRLVLEWADEENDTVEGLRRKTAAEFGKLKFKKQKKRRRIILYVQILIQVVNVSNDQNYLVNYVKWVERIKHQKQKLQKKMMMNKKKIFVLFFLFLFFFLFFLFCYRLFVLFFSNHLQIKIMPNKNLSIVNQSKEYSMTTCMQLNCSMVIQTRVT